MRERRATITDVARQAQVSRATASRVLGGYGYASDAVREKVHRAASQLGYTPSQTARAMRTGRSKLIGFVCTDITDGLFAGALGGICAVAESYGYQVLVFNSMDRLDLEIAGVDALVSQGAEGIIVSPVLVSQSGHLLKLADALPLVCLDRQVEKLPSVVSDDVYAASLAAEKIALKGHARIGFVTSVQVEEPISLTTGGDGLQVQGERRPSVQRARGFVSGLAKAGLAPTEEDFCLVDHRRGDGLDRVTQWFSRNEDVTAVVAGDSYQARIVYEALRNLGVRIPDDISLIVFSDADWPEMVSPALDRISLRARGMGSEAARSLLALLSSGSTSDLVTLDVDYHEGNSLRNLT
ncbi:LacI family transcriptional regulator [Brevibacterium luteolum]|uniref:LacI family transcriptional regulator n=1 Tax=Brevibacterium luteolum TaxID=199591 RepID=A0A6G8KWW3_9MICO|nr:LacI family transcriptional regulator [Brevibacterium luteolum]